MMNQVYKYGFIVAVVVLIISQLFNGRDKQHIKVLEDEIKQRDEQIDSLVVANKLKAQHIFKLQETMLVRADSLDSLKITSNFYKTNYEKNVAANRYRTVAEFEGYLADRYPDRLRGDSAQVAHGADR